MLNFCVSATANKIKFSSWTWLGNRNGPGGIISLWYFACLSAVLWPTCPEAYKEAHEIMYTKACRVYVKFINLHSSHFSQGWGFFQGIFQVPGGEFFQTKLRFQCLGRSPYKMAGISIFCILDKITCNVCRNFESAKKPFLEEILGLGFSQTFSPGVGISQEIPGGKDSSGAVGTKKMSMTHYYIRFSQHVHRYIILLPSQLYYADFIKS